MMIHIVRTTDLRLSDEPLPFDVNNRAAIDAHWAVELAANPRLWNGPFFMFSAISLDGDVLRGTAHRTDFATFLYWRSAGREGALHLTGTSLPVLDGGSLLAVRMGAHTANAGLVYFPAGSLDPADCVDGLFDVRANVMREFHEETGLAYDPAETDDYFIAENSRNSWHLALRCRFSLNVSQVREAIKMHQARGGDDEIDTVISLKESDDLSLLSWFALDLAHYHFQSLR